MSYKEFCTEYRRNEDIYDNFIGLLTGLYKAIIRFKSNITKEDKHCMSITDRFLKDFYSINDVNVEELEEYNRVIQLKDAYNNVLSTL